MPFLSRAAFALNMNWIDHTNGKKAAVKTKRLFTAAVRLYLVWSGLVAFQVGQAQTYVATDLGAPPSGTDSEAHAINRSGSVAGIWWTLTSGGNAFLYRNGTNTDLGNIGSGKYSIAYAANSTNQVVGQSSTSGGIKAPYHAFIFTNNNLGDLGALGDDSWSSANAINKSGLIAGESITAGGNIHAVLFQNGGISDLGTISNGAYSTALGINDSGIVVGNATVTVSPGITNTFGFICSNNVMSSVGTLGSGNYSTATAINNSGQVVGESATASGDIHAYILSAGTMTDLGTLGGGNYSTATAINNSSQVVGYAADASGTAHAFLYNGTTMINLDNAIAPGSDFSNLALAYGINDLGQIVGGGFNTNGHYVAFLLSPPVNVTTPITLTDNQFKMTMQGAPGQRFAIQASTDFVNWTSLNTNTLVSDSTNWADAGVPTNNCCFYRALTLP
jgi:probable HAF family extracellular repeat protein